MAQTSVITTVLGRQDSAFQSRTSCALLPCRLRSLPPPSLAAHPRTCSALTTFRILPAQRFLPSNVPFKREKATVLSLGDLLILRRWAGRIRTCGMKAPKAFVLPLDDGPISK